MKVVESRLDCLHCFMPSAEEIAEGVEMLSPHNTKFDIQHIETKRK
jgi:hypothetical protein